MKLKGLLIDPYQKDVHDVWPENDIHTWHKLLDCDCLDVAVVGTHDNQPIDVWVDDEGLLKKPQPPIFAWKGYHNPLCGYGLILSSNQEGESISTNLVRSNLNGRVGFEEWEDRLNPEDYFDQLSRIYPSEGTYGIGSKKGTLFCCLCGEPIDDPYGHNAKPLAEGRCCEKCNFERVVPERIRRAQS